MFDLINLLLISQILIDGRDGKAMDVEGQPLPTLVYLSREKRPKYAHNFKAGAMNALVSYNSLCLKSRFATTHGQMH